MDDEAEPFSQFSGQLLIPAICDMKWPFIAVLKLLRRMLKHIVGVHQQKFFCCQLAERNQLRTAAPASVAVLVNIAPGRNCPKLILAVPCVPIQAIPRV